MFLFPFSIDETMSEKLLTVPCWPFIFFQTSLSALTMLRDHRTLKQCVKYLADIKFLVVFFFCVLNFKRFHYAV